jgi:hypothetical protein
MVMTINGSVPDKHITPGQSHPPQGNGRYSQIGSADASGNSASDQAAAIYGSPDAPDAVRMDRMTNIAAEALSDTPDSTATASYADPFVQGNDWTLTPNKTVDDNGDLPSVPGFPGGVKSDSAFSYLGQPPGNQGKDLSDPVAMKPKPIVSNSSSPQATGRY